MSKTTRKTYSPQCRRTHHTLSYDTPEEWYGGAAKARASEGIGLLCLTTSANSIQPTLQSLGVRHDLCLALICCTQNTNSPSEILTQVSYATRTQQRGREERHLGTEQGVRVRRGTPGGA